MNDHRMRMSRFGEMGCREEGKSVATRSSASAPHNHTDSTIKMSRLSFSLTTSLTTMSLSSRTGFILNAEGHINIVGIELPAMRVDAVSFVFLAFDQ